MYLHDIFYISCCLRVLAVLVCLSLFQVVPMNLRWPWKNWAIITRYDVPNGWSEMEDLAVDLVAFGNQEWERKILFIKGGLNVKIIWLVFFHCHVWLPEGNDLVSPSHSGATACTPEPPMAFVKIASISTTLQAATGTAQISWDHPNVTSHWESLNAICLHAYLHYLT